MFKWKQPSTITIDIVWVAEKNNNLFWDHRVQYQMGKDLFYADEVGLYIPTEKMDEKILVPAAMIPNEYLHDVVKWHQNRGDMKFKHIAECKFVFPSLSDMVSGTVPVLELYLFRIRTDKNQPNQRKTIEATFLTARENITIKDLLDCCL
jgi:hypothetical protein